MVVQVVLTEVIHPIVLVFLVALVAAEVHPKYKHHTLVDQAHLDKEQPVATDLVVKVILLEAAEVLEAAEITQ